jgi:hypothetical protein
MKFMKYKYFHYLNGFYAAFPTFNFGLIPIEISYWNNNLQA